MRLAAPRRNVEEEKDDVGDATSQQMMTGRGGRGELEGDDRRGHGGGEGERVELKVMFKIVFCLE